MAGWEGQDSAGSRQQPKDEGFAQAQQIFGGQRQHHGQWQWTSSGEQAASAIWRHTSMYGRR